LVNLTINIPNYSDADSSFPKPINESYYYWIAIIEHFLTEADTIEIHCWNEEKESINEITSLYKGKCEMFKKEHLTIFNCPKSNLLIDYLLNNSLRNNGELKWFTLNLDKMRLPVLHSGHWGTELVITNINKEDIAFIKSVTPRDTDLLEY
jgi:hypothetical protein